ncbi:MAG TPA: hypothetical protein VFM34_05475 [Moraxellaceae bacterium]|nr:hypothetical protein [Moraxellaceae bacterium]
MKRMKGALPAALLGAACGLGGAGQALAQDVFRGCADSATHELRPGSVEVNDLPACKPRETQHSWNQAGPQGPQGPQGLQGPAGPSAAWYRNGQPLVVLPVSPLGTTQPWSDVGAIDLPAGQYVITGTAILGNRSSASDPAAVTCALASPYGGVTSDTALYAHDTRTLVATSGFDLPGPAQVQVKCRNANPYGDVLVSNFTLVAIKVGSLVQQ